MVEIHLNLFPMRRGIEGSPTEMSETQSLMSPCGLAWSLCVSRVSLPIDLQRF